MIRSDNGKEYSNNTLTNSVKEVLSTNLQHHTPGHPVAEWCKWKNKSKYNGNDKMRIAWKDYAKQVVAEAAKSSFHFLNRMPTEKAPQSMVWFQIKFAKHKDFCSLYFSYVPQVKRDKQDKRLNQVVLMDVATMSRLTNFW